MPVLTSNSRISTINHLTPISSKIQMKSSQIVVISLRIQTERKITMTIMKPVIIIIIHSHKIRFKIKQMISKMEITPTNNKKWTNSHPRIRFGSMISPTRVMGTSSPRCYGAKVSKLVTNHSLARNICREARPRRWIWMASRRPSHIAIMVWAIGPTPTTLTNIVRTSSFQNT